MPKGIVAEISVAPECNLSKEDVEQWWEELRKYMELFKPVFERAEQLKCSESYLRGLLGNASRKQEC